MSVIKEILSKMAEKQMLSGDKDFAYNLANSIDESANSQVHKEAMTFKDMIEKYATGKDPLFDEATQSNWDELVGRWNKELHPNHGVSRRVNTSSVLGTMIKKYAQLDPYMGEPGFENEIQDARMEHGFLGDDAGDYSSNDLMSNPHEPGSKEAMIWSDGFQAGRDASR